MAGKRGFASQLPKDLREELDRLIGEGGLSVDDVWTWLKGRNVEVGRSSVHRHMQSIEEVAGEMRQAREAASAIVEKLGPGAAEGGVGKLLIEVVQNIAFKIARDKLTNPVAPVMEIEELMFLASTAQKLSSAEATDADRLAKLRDAWAKEAAKKMDVLGKAQGWSADTAQKVRDELMGVRTAGR